MIDMEKSAHNKPLDSFAGAHWDKYTQAPVASLASLARVFFPRSGALYTQKTMYKIQDTIYEIAELASERKLLILDRVGEKSSYVQEELIAQTNLEVELFDAMDSLTPQEFERVFDVAISGGLVVDHSMSVLEKIDLLYLNINLGEFLKTGLKR